MLTDPDYVLDKNTRFILSAENPAAGFLRFPLRFSDPEFIRRFDRPAEIMTPAGEFWRLQSTEKQIGKVRLRFMVGYAEKASWKLDLPIPSNETIDAQLSDQLQKVVSAIREDDGKIEVPSSAVRKIAADGFEIVNSATGSIIRWGYQIPVYIPNSVHLPNAGTSLYRDEYDVYLVRTDDDDRLILMSTSLLGDLRALSAFFGLLFLFCGFIGYVSGNTFLRKYLMFSRACPSRLDEALKSGEGLHIEFKRSVSFESNNSVDQILQTITAFANTVDGTIFVGIEDDGKIKGISADDPKQKDSIAHRIYQLARQRVKPSPEILIDFIQAGPLTICRLFVPRGEEPLYFLDGVIYVRYGSSDIKAQPEIVKKLLAVYA